MLKLQNTLMNPNDQSFIHKVLPMGAHTLPYLFDPSSTIVLYLHMVFTLNYSTILIYSYLFIVL